MGSSLHTLNAVKTTVRSAAAAVILVASVLAAVAVGSACSRETKSFTGLMRDIPYSTGHFSYWAVGAIDADEDLWEIYDRFKQSPDAQQLKEFVPVLATIKQSAKIVSYDNTSLVNPVGIFRGDIDVNATEASLGTLDYSMTSYRGVAIWIRADNQTTFDSVAIESGTVLMGDASDLRSCIDVKGGARSLYDDPNIRLMVDRLPEGALVEVARFDASHGEQYADLVTYGKSYSRVKKDTLKLTAVYLFGDDPAANAAQEPVSDYLSGTFEGVKVRRDGHLVIATGEISVSKFAASLVF